LTSGLLADAGCDVEAFDDDDDTAD